jgi:thiosulfate reductase/polysulfide reductase chain A
MCEVCSNQCATILKLQNGKIREIVGNPADQLGSYGKVCVKGASAMRLLYDPDRLKTPLKRTNPKKGKGEDPKWVKISWEEAFKLVGSKFNQTIKEHGAESILFIAQPVEEVTYLQKCIGTPNFISHGDTCYLSQLIAWLTTTGTGHSITMDLANTKYI